MKTMPSVVCPGTLAAGFAQYSPACIRNLFDGIQVSPFLDFNYDADHADFIAEGGDE